MCFSSCFRFSRKDFSAIETPPLVIIQKFKQLTVDIGRNKPFVLV